MKYTESQLEKSSNHLFQQEGYESGIAKKHTYLLGFQNKR